jgi:cytochrome o ubiquinol oxidase subunit III
MRKHASDDSVHFGLWVYIMSDCVLFATLFAAYAVLHAETAGGATSVLLFDRSFVLLETLILLISSFTCGLAVLSAKYKNAGGVWAALLATLLLGAAFLALEIGEFAKLLAEGYGWSESAFLSSYFALVGTHGLHILAGMLWILVLLLHLAIRGAKKETANRLVSFSLFWHFLDIVWICIFSFVYLLGTMSL